MISQIKGLFLLIFLILLQSCSGGRIGNFLESSFDNLEKRNKAENRKNVLGSKKLFNIEKIENNKESFNKSKDDNSINVLGNKKLSNIKKIENDKKNNEVIRSEIKSKKTIVNEKKLDKNKKINKNNIQKKSQNELQSYKIIFILKDVDPKNPIDELSIILGNSELNFEIEKIERFQDSKNKIIKRN